VGFFCTCM